jgi:hypothetical protein
MGVISELLHNFSKGSFTALLQVFWNFPKDSGGTEGILDGSTPVFDLERATTLIFLVCNLKVMHPQSRKMWSESIFGIGMKNCEMMASQLNQQSNPKM